MNKTAPFAALILLLGCTQKPSDEVVRRAAMRRFFFEDHIVFCRDEIATNGGGYPVKFDIRSADPSDLDGARVASIDVFNQYAQTHDGEVFYIYHFSADYNGIPKRDLALLDQVFDGGTNEFYISMLGNRPLTGECVCSDTGTFSLVLRGNSWYVDGEWPIAAR